MRSAACALSAMLVIVVAWVGCASGDTIANCTYEDIEGSWTFSSGALYSSYDELNKQQDCSNFPPVKSTRLALRYPDVATDDLGNIGFWTLIYNQGFEIVIGNRKYFAFSRFEGTTFDCSRTMPSFTHDVLQRQWACFNGTKVAGLSAGGRVGQKPHLQNVPEQPPSPRTPNARYRPNPAFVEQINSVQNNWRAAEYPQFAGRRLSEMFRRSGGPASRLRSPRAKPASREQLQLATALPESFDWRSVGGQSFVAPVRDQGNCGSCYSFASAAMLESRIRLASNNTLQPILSPQDVVECSPYSQGCSGGFPYLIGGKYAEDFGFAEESCNPYKGTDGPCSTPKNCTRYYGTGYHYVGGYYGACNEVAMQLALLHDGPLAIGFEVYDDFMLYSGGVYTHTKLVNRFNPFELTNHAVLLVGYGIDSASGLKYWSVKNSWGPLWGESGYFRIRRGTDECAFESIALTTQAVL